MSPSGSVLGCHLREAEAKQFNILPWMPRPARSSRIPNLQSLNKTTDVIYYQIKSTNLFSGKVDKGSEIIATNFTCWSVQMNKLDQTNEKGQRNYHCLITAEDTVKYLDEEVETVSALNYTIKNAVQYVFTSAGGKETDPVIFTDGGSCDLLNVPREKSGKGCELWVKDQHKENVPSCCSFIYELLCAQEGSYDIYDKQKCKKVVDSWPSISRTSAQTMAQTIEFERLYNSRGNLTA
ncbi:uncharacterized protein LOC142563685 isoform X2 [Dermacentor variabilis]|uniref:uncharacterized protein LOC142563685 isoform X2 n=1 Tax=Dermacentor variabilis TaxID=34621 RepID=UPI003F5C98E2